MTPTDAPDVDLPPLPEPQEIRAHLAGGEGVGVLIGHAFFANQMQAYALQAVLRERERCAQICDSVDNYANPMTARDCAAAIRGEKK